MRAEREGGRGERGERERVRAKERQRGDTWNDRVREGGWGGGEAALTSPPVSDASRDSHFQREVGSRGERAERSQGDKWRNEILSQTEQEERDRQRERKLCFGNPVST